MILTYIGVSALKVFLVIYDIITLPVYITIQQPWKKWKAKKIIWAKHIEENNPYSPVIRISRNPSDSSQKPETIDELFRQGVIKYNVQRCVGTRKIITEKQEVDRKGKLIKKLHLGNYQWFTYNETEERVESLSKGFLNIGFQSKQPILIFAETRIEWFLSLHACMRINVPVATLYATLGEEGIVHAINETEVSTIIMSQGLLSKLENITDKLPSVNQIIIMEDSQPLNWSKFPSRISMIKFSEVEKLGSSVENVTKPEPPVPNDLALIMYTSGSTGTPKGVMLSHANIMACVSGAQDAVFDLKKFGDIYIAFLPLAHIFEMIVECLALKIGVTIGYSSPHTFTDKSLSIMEGYGDATVLKPNMMIAVPLMLDRIKKSMNQAISSKSKFVQKLFEFSMIYKQFWCEKGFNTPILNRLIFRKFKQILGGDVNIIMCSGAPLPLDTSLFIKTCLDVKILQCYACTETTANGTMMSIEESSHGTVGPPFCTSRIKLADWLDGGYTANDQPYPRGEIVIGGESVAQGYYKNPNLTKECFKEEDGTRWFYTGDIGELYPNGTFKIIDRKKDLVKLQCGEYISLGKVEAEIRTSPLVDNICIVAKGCHDFLISLVVPNFQELQSVATSLLGENNLNFVEMCQDNTIIGAVAQCLKDHAKKCRLTQLEIPAKFHMCSDEWLPETGLVTAALKIRRKRIELFYKDVIDKMFCDLSK